MKTNEKNIYNERNEIIKKEMLLKRKLLKLKEQEKKLHKNCNHNIVILFDDHIPRKIGKMFECMCPICSKKEEISILNRIENTAFRNSKIIDLTEYDIDIVKTFKIIQNEIHDRYDFYYNSTMNENRIKKSIIDNTNIENFEKIKK